MHPENLRQLQDWWPFLAVLVIVSAAGIWLAGMGTRRRRREYLDQRKRHFLEELRWRGRMWAKKVLGRSGALQITDQRDRNTDS